ncbi:MAG TPA: hypothetical protein VFH61_13640 [Thermoleophilia bacterium]|nr:hypothetical protein [Thermoleophilia bacterium]
MYQNGRQLSAMPPQASTNGFGQMPPQASTNGLGRYGMIGMMPPQAAAGVGDDMTPSGIPEGPMKAYRDGVFGARRQPQPFGDQLYPWRDGIFGPGLGQSNGAPTITIANGVVSELKGALNLLIASYHVTPGNSYDAATEAAYVSYVEEQTPGYPDKAELYKVVDGRNYPSARGIYVLMNGARVAWASDVGADESYARVISFYPTLWTFATAYEAASFTGSVDVPAPANGGAVKASTVALIGVSAIGIGLLAVMLKPKKRRSTPNRRRRRRR